MFVQTAVCGRPHVRWCERERRSYRFSLSTRYNIGMYPLLQKYQRCRFTDKQISDNITYCVNTPEETMRLRTALASGRDVYVNEALKINAERFAKSRYCHILRRIMTNEWDSFLAKFADRLTRPGLISAVESMIHCGDPKSGFVMYVCPHCGKTVMVCRTCKSRFCPSCGQLARERITRSVTETLADVPHRQMVLSVPPDLRPLMRKYRDPMLDVLFRSAQQALNLLLSWHAPDATKREGRRLGYIAFLHTCGRNLCWNPHLHILLAERYMTKDGKMHRSSYFPFDFIRKAFLGILLRNMYRTLKRLAESDGEARKDLRDFYRLRLETKKKYPKGYYVYSPRMKDAAGHEKKDGSRIKGMNALAKYVARYASHPAIAESRIISYDEEKHTVTWYYEPHEDDNLPEDQKFGAITVTDSAEKFISRLLIHVSSKGFKTIRYYGFYSQASKAKPSEEERMVRSSGEGGSRRTDSYEIRMLKTFGFTPFLCSCGTMMEPDWGKSYFPERSKGDG